MKATQFRQQKVNENKSEREQAISKSLKEIELRLTGFPRYSLRLLKLEIHEWPQELLSPIEIS